MNSIHDLGGMHGMGPLPFEANEPFFHEDWERIAFGLMILPQMTGLFNADESRYSMERIPALHWLESPYYLHWLDGIETIFVEKGLATREEMAAGHVTEKLPDWAAELPPVNIEDIEGVVTTNHPVTGPLDTKPKYQVGDKVRAKNINPKTHTRLPRYTRGKVGTIMAYHAPCNYADKRARGDYAAVDHTYAVRFEGAELWGPDAGPKDAVYIDLYEDYLENL